MTSYQGTSRSVLALTNGGHVIFIDSDHGVVGGYPPFTDALGHWRCLSAPGELPRLSATMLDFTMASETSSKQIARVDFEAIYVPATATFEATGTLSFTPLEGNPYGRNALKGALPLKFNGVKIVAP